MLVVTALMHRTICVVRIVYDSSHTLSIRYESEKLKGQLVTRHMLIDQEG